MNILLVYPKTPDTFWSFNHALKFVSKKATNPPLGLLTVSAMLPKDWKKELVDLNVSALKNEKLEWADLVFISAMSIQRNSALEIIRQCKKLNKIIVAGGPLFTEEPESFSDINHMVLNEAELTLPVFLDDFKSGNPKRIYSSNKYADLKDSPIPDYSLLKKSKYSSLTLQFSRGCPYDCEFCDITALLGRKVRTKTSEQIINELENIYETGWRDAVFFVDDNFIGNKKVIKENLLPAIAKWMKKHSYPFAFQTEASINLADDQELLEQMVIAGFCKAFIGIESPDEASLEECNKQQNKKRNLVESVRQIQDAGIEVSAGFIVGFDNDTSSIFRRQIDFIEESGIITAMVGLLNAPKKTKLYKRLTKEGRILNEWTGNNTDSTLNFIPKMDRKELLKGYQNILQGIYSSKAYCKRVIGFLKNYKEPQFFKTKFSFSRIIALFKSIFIIGLFRPNRYYFWKLVFWSLFNRPRTFPSAIKFSIYGYHYQKIFSVT